MTSKRTDFELINNTPLSITNTWVTEIDNFDWDGASRPDNNFKNANIDPYSSKKEREEINSNTSSALFRIYMEFESGDVISVRIDQRDALLPENLKAAALPIFGEESLQMGKVLLPKCEGNGENKFLCSFSATGDYTSKLAVWLKKSPDSWMAAVSNNKSISSINIPGTHDSCARYGGFPVACQDMTIKEQLDAGIRYLDIRCRHINNGLAIHHAGYFQHIYFQDVLATCKEFIQEHPEETIIMLIKEEYDEEDCTETFEETFLRYINLTKGFWFLEDRIPDLGETRGKIVLIRRFKASKELGIQALKWEDDATFTINKIDSKINIQDEYTVNPFAKNNKWRAVENFFNTSRFGRSKDWYINYCSGFDGSPENVANYVNPQLIAYVSQALPFRLGTVVMDFPVKSSRGLLDLIISTNVYD